MSEKSLPTTDSDDLEDRLTILKNLKLSHPLNITIGYININSVRHKLDDLYTFLGNTIDILAISETKLDAAFTTSRFVLPGYKKQPLRLDDTDSSGGLMVFVREDIIMHELKSFVFPKVLTLFLLKSISGKVYGVYL